MTDPMNLESIPKKNPNAAFRTYDGEATIVLPDRAEVKVLNPSGSTIWEAIDGRRSLGEILDLVLREYETTREEAEADLLEFVASLREQGMVS